MTKYVTLFDGTELSFPDESMAVVEKAMTDKLPIRLQGNLVNGSSIAKISEMTKNPEYGPHIAARSSSIMQLAAGVFEDKPQGMSYETRRKIMDTLRKTDDTGVLKKKAYFASNRLAYLLHDPKGKKWGLLEWERFNSEHPEPWEEYEKLMGHEEAYSDLQQNLPEDIIA